MKRIPWISIASVLIIGVVTAGNLQEPDEGLGPVASGPITIGGAILGTHWFGPEISHKDLKGKVVLFEIYGS